MTKEEIFEILISWENMEFMMKEIIHSTQNYHSLMELALYDKRPMTWRAAYMIDKINDKQPGLLKNYLIKIMQQVLIEKQKGERRHFLKLISMNAIPEGQQGVMLDFCIKTFKSAKEDIAVRVHAMQILYNLTLSEPDLIPEILAVIEHEMAHHSSAGITSRGKKLVKQLKMSKTTG